MRKGSLLTALGMMLGVASASSMASFECHYQRLDMPETPASKLWFKSSLGPRNHDPFFEANAVTSEANPVTLFSVDSDDKVLYRCRNTETRLPIALITANFDSERVRQRPVYWNGDIWTQFILNKGESARLDYGLADEVAYVMATDRTIPADAPPYVRDVVLTEENQLDTIRQGGTYIVRGVNTGRVEVRTRDTVYLIGQDQAQLISPVQGNPAYNPNKGVIHADAFVGTVYVSGITVKIPSRGMFGGWLKSSNSTLTNIMVTSPDTTSSSEGNLRGRGGLEIGENGIISHSVIVPGDDAIRLTDQDTYSDANIVHMLGNGNVFQLGWAKKWNGHNHIGTRTRVYGTIRPNLGRDRFWEDPTRAVVAGMMQRTGGTVEISGLDIRMDSVNTFLKLFTDPTKTNRVWVDDFKMSGVVHGFPYLSFYEEKNYWKYPLTMRALQPNHEISNVDIDLASAWFGLFPVNNEGRDRKSQSESIFVEGNVSGTVDSLWSSWAIEANEPEHPTGYVAP